MKLGNCEILAAVEGVRGADVYEVEVADSGRHMVVRIASRAVPPRSAAAEESERFLAEAAPFVGLDHPNVLGLVDYGEQDGLRFMIDPYVGGPLLDFLVSGQSLPLTLPVARSIIADAAAGLQYLHDQGIVHGCVNVRTLMMEQTASAGPFGGVTLGATARVLVGDFGLHRYFEEGTPADGQTFAEFLAPEQHREPAQAASDQYALAVLAHLLLTGRLPVISSRSRPIEDVSPGDLVPPSQLNPALPPAIDYLLNTALQPDPAQRFRQVRDLATALDIAAGVAPHPASPHPEQRADGDTMDPAAGASAASMAPSEAMSVPAPVPVGAPADGAPPARPPAEPAYLLPKAPPYTEPVRVVKAPAETAKRPRKARTLPTVAGLRMSRRTLLGMAGGVAGVAVLGGGLYFFTRQLRSGVADSIGVFRPAASSFLLLSSLAAHGPDIVVPFGRAGDLPLAGDWSGDGIDTPGVFRPDAGMFYLASANTSNPRLARAVAFGQLGDIPLAGDWTGSGRDSIGIFRPATGQFLLKRTLDPGPAEIAIRFGTAGDLPLAGDWTGSGRDSIGIYRPSEDAFHLVAHAAAQHAPSADYTLHLGVGQGRPLAGDWQRTGHSGVGLFVSATRTVYLTQRLADGSAPEMRFALGEASDLPVAGHWR